MWYFRHRKAPFAWVLFFSFLKILFYFPQSIFFFSLEFLCSISWEQLSRKNKSLCTKCKLSFQMNRGRCLENYLWRLQRARRKYRAEIGRRMGWDWEQDCQPAQTSSWRLSAAVLSARLYHWRWLEFCGFIFVLVRVEDWHLIQKERERNGWTDLSLGWCVRAYLAGIPTDRQVIIFLHIVGPVSWDCFL